MSKATETTEPKKKRGPVPRLGTGKYTVILDEELAEWGKYQPGGLSETLRRLLQEAKQRAERQK